jgi:putative transposase
MNGLYKTELVRKGPWRGFDDLELATLEWVDWFNHRRLFEDHGRIPPAEFEDRYYRHVKLTPQSRDSHPRACIEPGAVHALVANACT